ncbi:MAG TPA: DUF1684 domain-containing protein [Candidatus Limnocylindrales bacterium]|nr:DUF1684 domain-containing protein [Candidatus Limnocylindrales bacterium]
MTHDDHEHAHGHEHHISYEDAVRQFRAEKDEFFRAAEGSPIPADQRASFTGLPYFDVNPQLVADGLSLEPYGGTEPTQFQIPTSDGQLRPAERAGVFRFEMAATPLTLTGYRIAGGDAESVFVPFLDATSGTETYGAGRYLDLFAEDDGTWTLDFNLAYHPSCVYDARFSCPLTPAENRLPIRIEAGERLPAG